MAYDLIDDPEVKATCRDLITRLTDYLLKAHWMIINPGTKKILETYVGMVDQQLSILQVAKHVNPEKFASKYESHRRRWTWLMGLPIWVQTRNLHKSYYKFNLEYIYFYNLVRLEKDPKIANRYMKTYNALRRATKTHINPHFNMIDFALNGAEAYRDQETRQALADLLKRGFRDQAVDLRGKYKACGENQACVPIPILERPFADFLWQRTPFILYGGIDGSAQSPGVDYVLTYWMARYYGVER